MEAQMLNTGYPYVPIMASVTIEKLREDAILPKYASEGDSGMDVYAPEDVEIQPGEIALVKLGWKIGIPRHPLHDYGYRWELQVRPRSGVSAKTKIRVANAPGTVDNFYISEVGIILDNIGEHAHKVNKGDRIAQLVFTEVLRPLRIIEGEVPKEGRVGGFGSTGT